MNLTNLLFPALLFAVAYWFLIRPQTQEQERLAELHKTLAKDDRVITASGIHGRVVEVGDDTVVLEVSDRARITFDKSAVARKQGEPVSA